MAEPPLFKSKIEKGGPRDTDLRLLGIRADLMGELQTSLRRIIRTAKGRIANRHHQETETSETATDQKIGTAPTIAIASTIGVTGMGLG